MDSAYLIGLDNEDGTKRQVVVIQETLGSKEGGVELSNTFNLHEGVEELGTITFNQDYTEWKYSGTLNRDDQNEIAKALERRYIDSEVSFFDSNEGFSFVANVNQDDVVIEVTPINDSYAIKINGDDMGTIQRSGDGEKWIANNKEIADVLVQEIGDKIEAWFL